MGGGHSWREGGRVKASERERKEGRTGEREGRGVQSWREREREGGKEFHSWGEREGGIIDVRGEGGHSKGERGGGGVEAGERAGRQGHSWGKRRGVKVGERERGERGIQELSTCLLRSEKSY